MMGEKTYWWSSLWDHSLNMFTFSVNLQVKVLLWPESFKGKGCSNVMFSFFRSWAKGNSSLPMLFSLLLSKICQRKENHWRCVISKTNRKILHVHRSETGKFLSTYEMFIQHWRTENYLAIIPHLLTKIQWAELFFNQIVRKLSYYMYFTTFFDLLKKQSPYKSHDQWMNLYLNIQFLIVRIMDHEAKWFFPHWTDGVLNGLHCTRWKKKYY